MNGLTNGTEKLWILCNKGMCITAKHRAESRPLISEPLWVMDQALVCFVLLSGLGWLQKCEEVIEIMC